MKCKTIYFFLLFSVVLQAQSDLPIYGWKSYLPYLNGRLVTQSDTKIIYATEYSILSIDKEDDSVNFLSKVEGLSDICVEQMIYDEFNDQLIVVYLNSNIDLIKDDEVFNIKDIKNNTNIVGDRRINALEVANSEHVYFATAFGIVQYNLERREFGFTTVTGVNVLDITSSDEFIYAATEDGVYAVPLNQNLNLGDFGNWDLLGPDVGLPFIYSAPHVDYFNESLYVVVEDTLFRQGDMGQFEKIYEELRPEYEITFINAGSRMMLGTWDGEITSEVLYFNDNGTITKSEEGCLNIVRDAIEDEDGVIWFADQFNGLRRAENMGQECLFPKSFNSPAGISASDFAFANGEVYVASGGVSDALGGLGSTRGFYRLVDGEWKIYNFNYDPIKDNNVLNVWKAKKHPTNSKIYFASYAGGLLEFDSETEEGMVYNKDNSSLQVTQGGNPNRTRVSGLEFDNEGNLWMTNYGAEMPISVLTVDGEFRSFRSAGNTQLFGMTIDQNGYKWAIAQGNNGGVLVYDDAGTINDPNDDPFPKFFNVGNSELSTNLINSIKADLNGDVWVGTAEGPIVFECGGGTFDPECRGTRRKVLQDSIGAFLLQTEDIRVIEVDGANRKWFGTRNGIFLQSPDGVDQIAHFTEDNSPLFDNTINALSFNNETGEMWIGTNKGMQAFRTDATGPERFHREDNVIAFPNPVRPDYTGPIAIKGLVENAEVKITDVNGHLVFETTSLGGQAIWDGQDYNGNRAATGVYLVFSSSSSTFSDPDTAITKILIVN